MTPGKGIREKYTQQAAREIAKEAGYAPREPYPGAPSLRWKATCKKCMQPRIITVLQMVGGRRCSHRVMYDLPVDDVVKKYEARISVRALAAEYGVSFGKMYQLLQRNTTLRTRGGNTRKRRVRA